MFENEESEFAWEDFQEDESTDAIPDKYILTITKHGEEFATIVHRASEAYPIDGNLANQKRENAQLIVDALNTYTH